MEVFLEFQNQYRFITFCKEIRRVSGITGTEDAAQPRHGNITWFLACSPSSRSMSSWAPVTSKQM